MTSNSRCIIFLWIVIVSFLTNSYAEHSPEILIHHSNFSSNIDDYNKSKECYHHINNYTFNNNNDTHSEHPFAVCTGETGDGEHHLQCIEGIEKKWLKNPHCDISTLTLISWPGKTFPTEYIFRYFPFVKHLNIFNSSFSKFDEDFPSSALRLKKIVMNGLSNIEIKKHVFSRLPSLEVLNLRNNFLTKIHPEFINTISKLTKIYLRDNKWNCSHHGLLWLVHLNNTSEIIAKSKIADYKDLTCQGNMYPGKPLHLVMDLKKQIHVECPDSCTCQLSNLVRDPKANSFVPLAEVDCRNRGLISMPSKLPSFKTILLLQGNNISDIQPLVEYSVYKNVTDLYLDNNSLTNVGPLEGAEWLHSFVLFSLRGNNISQLPTYAFDHAFESNLKMIRVFLGNNPWNCNCHFIPVFQEFIIKYSKVIVDLSDIKCKNGDQPEISNTEISTLSRNIICRQSEEIIHTVDIINIFLASLIILVIGNFAYNYYWFKKTGRLPWIASKIP